MRWNPFRRAETADASDSGFESTVVDEAAGSRAAGSHPAPGRPSTGASAAVTTGGLIVEGDSIGHVGRYALKAVLGVGGLGTVYAAWDPLLSRTVALKTLHIDADPAARESLDALFLNEARAAAGLSHPHIVTVFDAGPATTGVYIAMERLQGQDLRHLLQQGVRPGPIEAAQVVRRVADALAYAHRKGVVHCDVKPANIFMTGRMHPKVLDFGIARVAHRDASPALDGVLAGSPYYLAPEQIDGRSVDRRSDVYSLGVVLYELLAGKKPFEGKSIEEITNAVKNAEVVPAHRVNSKVPLGLSVIAARAMARDPDQRYPSARHLSMELRHWVDSAEARALLNGARGNGSATPLAVRVARVAVPLGTLAALGLVAAVWWPRSAPPPALPAAVAPAPAAEMPAAAPPPVVAATPSATTPAPSASSTIDEASALAAATVAAAAASTDPPGAAHALDKAALALALAKADAARKRKVSPVASSPDAPPPPPAPALGVVQLAVSPWGQIEVDGRPMGTSPPLTRLTLASGTHTITVRNADYPAYTSTLAVGGDNPVTLRHRFGP